VISKNFIETISEGELLVAVRKIGEVYKCEICENVVIVKEVGGGEMICCGQPMILVE
jgi:desulfoferrodoxin-like iron-binding protein